MSKKLKFYYWGAPIEDATINFGDLLTPLLMKHYCGDSVEIATSVKDADIFSVGSILGRVKKHKFAIILGSGHIRNKKSKPLKRAHCYALRGPHSKRILGIEEPVALGDPGLLMPYIFPKSNEPDTNAPIGIVPHYEHFAKPELAFYKGNPRYRVIDVKADPESVINQICSCSAIFSSSLHGLIIADAYKIPNVRLIFDDALFGGEFKFNDYFDAIDRKGTARQTIKPEEIEAIYNSGIDTQYFSNIQKAQEDLDNAFKQFATDIPKLTEERYLGKKNTTFTEKLSRFWKFFSK